jgi:hypothetical protein
MLFLLPIAVGLAALRDPSELWASSVFSLTVGVLLVSALGTAARRGASRIAFLGFTLFGGSYLVLAFGPSAWINPDGLRPPTLVTRILLDRIRESQLGPAANWKVISVGISLPNTVVQIASSPADLTNPQSSTGPLNIWSLYIPYEVSPYKQIAHSMLALVVGTLGAVAGRILVAREAGSSRC